jgi:hypothetical protein
MVLVPPGEEMKPGAGAAGGGDEAGAQAEGEGRRGWRAFLFYAGQGGHLGGGIDAVGLALVLAGLQLGGQERLDQAQGVDPGGFLVGGAGSVEYAQDCFAGVAVVDPDLGVAAVAVGQAHDPDGAGGLLAVGEDAQLESAFAGVLGQAGHGLHLEAQRTELVLGGRLGLGPGFVWAALLHADQDDQGFLVLGVCGCLEYEGCQEHQGGGSQRRLSFFFLGPW